MSNIFKLVAAIFFIMLSCVYNLCYAEVFYLECNGVDNVINPLTGERGTGPAHRIYRVDTENETVDNRPARITDSDIEFVIHTKFYFDDVLIDRVEGSWKVIRENTSPLQLGVSVEGDCKRVEKRI